MNDRVALRNQAKVCWDGFLAIVDVLFHRAWISTLGLAVTAFVLLRIDQTQDLLKGIGAQFFSNEGLFAGGAIPWSDIKGYAAYWISAGLLAAVLALLVWVTGTREANATTAGRTRYRPVWRSAQIIMATTLGLAYVVLLPYLPHAGIHYAYPILFFGIVFLPWLLLHRLHLKHRLDIIISAAISVIAGAVILAPFLNNPALILVGLSAALPSLAVVAMTALRFCVSTDRRAGVIALSVATILLSAAVIYPWKPSVIWTIGTIPVGLIWLAFVAILLTWIVLLLRWVRPFVGLDPILPLLLAGVLLYTGNERLGRESLGADSFAARGIAENAPTPVASNSSGNKNETIVRPGVNFAIHADGGGLRAALYTALVLAFADDRTCGEFGKHVLAASGVSGGSLGIATWAVLRQEYVEINGEKAWSDCAANRAKRGHPAEPVPLDGNNPLDYPLSFRVYGLVAQDHLSSTIAAMLTSDFLPGGEARRGQALLDSWQVAANDVLLNYDGADWGSRPGFSIPLKNVTAGLEKPPVLLFTTTDADTGSPVVFSNAQEYATPGIEEVSIGVAALHSARFPLISPAGRVQIGGKEIRVVDGGYFDNSGAFTLRGMLLKAQGKLGRKVTVVRINGNASESEDPRCGAFFKAINWEKRQPHAYISPLWTDDPQREHRGWSGTKALMQARETHADEIVKDLHDTREPSPVSRALNLQLSYQAGFDPKCQAFVLSSEYREKPEQAPCVQRNAAVCYGSLAQTRAPLGWYLSRQAAAGVDRLAFIATDALRRAMLPGGERQQLLGAMSFRQYLIGKHLFSTSGASGRSP